MNTRGLTELVILAGRPRRQRDQRPRVHDARDHGGGHHGDGRPDAQRRVPQALARPRHRRSRTQAHQRREGSRGRGHRLARRRPPRRRPGRGVRRRPGHGRGHVAALHRGHRWARPRSSTTSATWTRSRAIAAETGVERAGDQPRRRRIRPPTPSPRSSGSARQRSCCHRRCSGSPRRYGAPGPTSSSPAPPRSDRRACRSRAARAATTRPRSNWVPASLSTTRCRCTCAAASAAGPARPSIASASTSVTTTAGRVVTSDLGGRPRRRRGDHRVGRARPRAAHRESRHLARDRGDQPAVEHLSASPAQHGQEVTTFVPHHARA